MEKRQGQINNVPELKPALGAHIGNGPGSNIHTSFLDFGFPPSPPWFKIFISACIKSF